RTAALGGHRRQCEACGHEELSYNSCRDRHCPKCQGLDEARWIQAQQRDLLPVQYFHLVFTVPTELHSLFLTAPPVAYRLLFTAAAKTLQDVARRRLGATLGFTAVLHTWTQLLLYHPPLQRPARRPAGRPGHLPLEGPRSWQRPPARYPRRPHLSAPLSAPRLAPPLRPHPALRLPRQLGAPADTAPGAPVARPVGARHPIAGTPRPGTVGRAAPPPDRQGCHPLSAVRGWTPRRRGGVACARAIPPFPSPSAEPLNGLAARSAPSTSALTLALCLSRLSRPRRAVPLL